MSSCEPDGIASPGRVHIIGSPRASMLKARADLIDMGIQRHSCSIDLGRGPAVILGLVIDVVVQASLPSDPTGQSICRDLYDVVASDPLPVLLGLEIIETESSVRFCGEEGIREFCCGWCAVFAITVQQSEWRFAPCHACRREAITQHECVVGT